MTFRRWPLVFLGILLWCEEHSAQRSAFNNVNASELSTSGMKIIFVSDAYCSILYNASSCPNGATAYSGPGFQSVNSVPLALWTVAKFDESHLLSALSVSFSNTRGFFKNSVKGVLNAAKDSSVSAIFGAETSCDLEAMIAASRNKLFIDHYCKPRQKHDTFVQLKGSFQALADTAINFMKTNKWDRVVIVHFKDLNTPEMLDFKARLTDLLLQHRILTAKTYGISALKVNGEAYATNYSPQQKRLLLFSTILKETYLITRAYIIMSCANVGVDTMWFIEIMGRMGLLQTGEYVVLNILPRSSINSYNESVETSQAFLRARSPLSPFKAPIRQLIYNNYRSVAIFSETVPQESEEWRNFKTLNAEFVKNYSKSPPCPPLCDMPIIYPWSPLSALYPHAAILYNGIVEYAAILRQVITENKTDIHDGYGVKQYFYSLRFGEDLSGVPVQLDGKATAIASVTVSTATYGPKGLSGIFPVGTYRISTTQLSYQPRNYSFNWVNGQPPPPGPKCGFDLEKCPTPIKQKTKWWLIAVFAVIIAVISIGGGYIYYKRHLRLQRLIESAWKIELKDLVIWDVGPQFESNDSLGSDDSDLSEKSGSTSQMHRSSKSLRDLAKPDLEEGAGDDIEAAAAPVGTIAEAAAQAAANAAKARAAARAAQLAAMDTIEEAPLLDDDSGPSTSRSTAVIAKKPEKKGPSKENIEFTKDVERHAKKKAREERRLRRMGDGVKIKRKRKKFSDLEDWQEVGTFTSALYKGRIVGVKRVWRTTVEPLTKKMKSDIWKYTQLRSECVVKLLGVVFEHNHVFTMLEYCHKGNLHEMLTDSDIKLERMFISAIVFDIVSGLRYLKHAERIGSHGRLSSSNCLITSTWRVKLAGFGLWSFLDTEHRDELNHEEFCAKKLYTAPELIRLNFESAPAFWRADVYSLGIVLHEIYSRQGPWASVMSATEIIERVKTPRIHEPLCRPRFDAAIAAPKFMCDIMAECWAENAYMRPRYGDLWEKLQPLREGLSYNLLDNVVELMKRYNNNLEEVIEERVRQEEIELEKCEALLASMLPKKVSDVLKLGLPVEPEKFEDITLYFSDVVGYSNYYSLYNVYQVINFLDAMFKHMDALIKEYDVYKVETINDSYMAVSGLPKRNKELHSGEIASMALHIMRDVKNHKIKQPNGEIVQMRMGIHSGLVMAGVVGLKMPRYCLFGDTVNTTSRFESTSIAFKIHCSEECRQRLLKLGGYEVVERGLVFMKGKGEKLTYWLVSENASVREQRMKENAEWLAARPDV